LGEQTSSHQCFIDHAGRWPKGKEKKKGNKGELWEAEKKGGRKGTVSPTAIRETRGEGKKRGKRTKARRRERGIND